MSCCSIRLASVISRREAMMPSTCPDSLKSGLAVVRNRRISPVLVSARTSITSPAPPMLHFATLGDVRESSLLPAGAPPGVADQGGAMQASDRGAVTAAQGDFVAMERPGARHLALLCFPFHGLVEKVRERPVEEGLAIFIAEH